MRKRKEATLDAKKLPTLVKKSWQTVGELKLLSLSCNGCYDLRWVESFDRAHMSREAFHVLITEVFQERNGAKFDLAFLNGGLFSSDDCHIEKAREFAKSNGLVDASVAAFPLLCEMLSKENGRLTRPATIILMHKELLDKQGQAMQLSVDLLDNSIRVGHYSGLNCEKKFYSQVYFVFGANGL